MNKPKMRRSRKKEGYYKQQFAHTEANKHRQAAKRKRRAALWKKLNTL